MLSPELQLCFHVMCCEVRSTTADALSTQREREGEGEEEEEGEVRRKRETDLGGVVNSIRR